MLSRQGRCFFGVFLIFLLSASHAHGASVKIGTTLGASAVGDLLSASAQASSSSSSSSSLPSYLSSSKLSSSLLDDDFNGDIDTLLSSSESLIESASDIDSIPVGEDESRVDAMIGSLVDGGVSVGFGQDGHFVMRRSSFQGDNSVLEEDDILVSDDWFWGKSEDEDKDEEKASLGDFAKHMGNSLEIANEDEKAVDELVRSSYGTRRVASAFFFGLFNGVMLGFGDNIKAAVDDASCDSAFNGVATARASLIREVMRLFAGYKSESLRGGRGYTRWTFHQISVIAKAVVRLLAEVWSSARACEPLWKLLKTLLIVIIVVVVAIIALMVLAPWAMVVVQIGGLVLTLGALVPFMIRQWRALASARRLPRGIERTARTVEHLTAMASGVIAALLFAGISKVVKLTGPRMSQLLTKPGLAVKFRLSWHPQLLADIKAFAKMLGLCKKAARGGSNGARAADDAAKAVDDFMDDAKPLPDDTVVPDGGGATNPNPPKNDVPKKPVKPIKPKPEPAADDAKKLIDDVVDNNPGKKPNPKPDNKPANNNNNAKPDTTPKQYEVDEIVKPGKYSKPVVKPTTEDEAIKLVSEARKAVDTANDEYHIVKGHAMDFEKVSGLRKGKPDLSQDKWVNGYNRGVDKSGPLAHTHSPSHAGNPWSGQVDDAFGNVEAAKANLRKAQRYLDEFQAKNKGVTKASPAEIKEARAAVDKARKAVEKAETDVLNPKMEFKEATWNREAWGKKNPTAKSNPWDEDVEAATKAYEAAKSKVEKAREALMAEEGKLKTLSG